MGVDKRSFSLCVSNKGITSIKLIEWETWSGEWNFCAKKCADLSESLKYIKIINCINKIHVINLEVVSVKSNFEIK